MRWLSGLIVPFALCGTLPAFGDTYLNLHAQTDAAIRQFCSVATPLSCSLYRRDAEQCRHDASFAVPYLANIRMWKQRGLTAQQAARMSSLNMAWLAEEASHIPDTTTPDAFSMQVLNECLQAATPP